MTPLIDADVLLHELGHSGEFKDKETGEKILLDFDHVQELLDKKIDLICEDVDATTEPVLFFTDSEWLNKRMNKERQWYGQPTQPYIRTFLYDVATTKPYKGTRKNPKPYHFYNILEYLRHNYTCIVAEGGLEADDELCIFQNRHRPKTYDEYKHTIICSRDKDLRISPGWHFSWECGKQRSLGPYFTDRVGRLEMIHGKFVGFGLAFFYYQMIVGDSADNIPGLPLGGHKMALKLLLNCRTEEEYKLQVKYAYKKKGLSKEYFMEQASLLWMIQERGKGYEL